MKTHAFFWTVWAPLVFTADRVTKLEVLRSLEEGQSVALVPGWIHLTRVNNSGAAFGMMRHFGGMLVGVSAVSVAVLFFYIGRHFFRKEPVRAANQVLGWALVLGGAAGNLTDRLAYGYVVDFIDLRVWPVFNVADMSICAGVFLVAAGLLRVRAREGA